MFLFVPFKPIYMDKPIYMNKSFVFQGVHKEFNVDKSIFQVNGMGVWRPLNSKERSDFFFF